MRKFPKRNVVLDKLHRGFVSTCFGVALGGAVYFVYGWYNYYSVVKPAVVQKDLLNKQELLLEGSSEKLQDTAPTLNM